ncbi:MAG: hypothetical protein NTX52_14305 [Planctomycetota bacterium]|nr:hypothetical protein [Planctomycetota bacterium]
MGRKFGFSFSWKRALGISGAKSRISRKIGIPLTRSGRQRKIGRKSGCFVATATYGNEDSVEVRFLRAYRDEILLYSHFGRFLSRIYYKVGPVFAWFIERIPFLKRLARRVLYRVMKLIEVHTSLKLEVFQMRKNK